MSGFHTPLSGRPQHLHVSLRVCMCVYDESLRGDGCLQWSGVICLHYTPVAQPPSTIIYSDLPKHMHPETGSMLGAPALCLEHIMAFSGLSTQSNTQTEDTPKQRPFPSPTPSSFISASLNMLLETVVHHAVAFKPARTRLPSWPACWSGAALRPGVAPTGSDVVTKRSHQASYQFWQTEFC